MEFRNEIAAIGQLSLTGNPLTKNVAASYRRGVELEGSWRMSSRVTATANLTVMKARIVEYYDAPSGNTYFDVEPLLTPPVIANGQLERQLTSRLSLIARRALRRSLAPGQRRQRRAGDARVVDVQRHARLARGEDGDPRCS